MTQPSDPTVRFRKLSLLKQLIQAPARAIVERISGIHSLWDIYDQMEHREDEAAFVAEVLHLLKIEVKVDEKELERITSSGPVVVVSNHPHGALDGIILAHILLGVRKDVRFLANPILSVIEELKNLFFFVEPYRDPLSFRKNIGASRQAIRWLKSGGLLTLFPSGEVSHIDWGQWKVRDPEWNESVAKIIRNSKATVVPIRIDGQNSLLFQLAGLIHPMLRTLLLPRELINKKNSNIEVRIGKPISFARLPTELSDRELVKYFRFRSNLLTKSETFTEEKKSRKIKVFPSKRKERIAPHEGTSILAHEVEQLPPEQILLKSSTHSVYIAHAWQMPHLLNEIGRLREKTFRRVGEGTGLSRDLDEFDSYYLHLFVWNEEAKEIVGAYRVGKTDEIVQKYGIRGLYTHSLFDYGSDFIETIHPGLELGRSFIRPKYQKALTSLSLLWKGIGQFIHRNPHYRYLFGPVSISNDYSLISKNLIVDFIRENSFDPRISQVVQGRTPFKSQSGKSVVSLSDIRGFVKEMDDLSDLVGDLEKGFDGVPILLRHYLRLGGKLLAFNVDKNFANSLDGLIRVDLLEGNKKMIQNYMGKPEYEAYIAHHEKTSNGDSSESRANVIKIKPDGSLD